MMSKTVSLFGKALMGKLIAKPQSLGRLLPAPTGREMTSSRNVHIVQPLRVALVGAERKKDIPVGVLLAENNAESPVSKPREDADERVIEKPKSKPVPSSEEILRACMRISAVTFNGYSKDEFRKIHAAVGAAEKKELDAQRASGVRPIENQLEAEFYRPLLFGSDTLAKVQHGDAIASARTLIMFSITHRNNLAAIKAEMDSVSKIIGTKSVRDFDRETGGIVACIPKSLVSTDNRTTLAWLIKSDLNERAKEIDLIFEKFMRPKLFNNGTLISPEEFKGANFITISFSNRKVDMLMGLTTKKIEEVGGDPLKYLSRIHVLELCSNPYLWPKDWVVDDQPWMKAVKYGVTADTVYNRWDCATRPPEEIMPFIHTAVFNDQKHCRLIGSNRQMRIVHARADGNYCGHRTDHLVDALSSFHSRYCYSGLSPYYRGNISIDDLNDVRKEGNVYVFDEEAPAKYQGPKDPVTGLSPAGEYFFDIRFQALQAEMRMNGPEQYRRPGFSSRADGIVPGKPEPSDKQQRSR